MTPDRSFHHHPSNWRLHYWNITMKQAWISPIFKDFLRNPSSQPNYMPQEQHPSKRSQKWFLTISLIYPSKPSFSHTTNKATVPNSSTSRRHIINLNYIQFTKFISKNFFPSQGYPHFDKTKFQIAKHKIIHLLDITRFSRTSTYLKYPNKTNLSYQQWLPHTVYLKYFE